MNRNKDIVFPWGPLLLRQELDPSLVDLFIEKFPKSGNKLLLAVPQITNRITYPNDEWEGFNKLLYPYIKNYVSYFPGKEKLDFELVGLWGNIYRANDYVTPHIHSNCDLSFVFYLKIPPNEFTNYINKENEGNIIFEYGERQGDRVVTPNICVHNISPKKGELYIFPSNLRHHSIPLTHPRAERVSVSGNIKFI